MMWRRDQSTLNSNGGFTRSWTWEQWRRGSIIASTRRTALLKTRQAEYKTVEEMTPCAQCIYNNDYGPHLHVHSVVCIKCTSTKLTICV